MTAQAKLAAAIAELHQRKELLDAACEEARLLRSPDQWLGMWPDLAAVFKLSPEAATTAAELLAQIERVSQVADALPAGFKVGIAELHAELGASRTELQRCRTDLSVNNRLLGASEEKYQQLNHRFTCAVVEARELYVALMSDRSVAKEELEERVLAEIALDIAPFRQGYEEAGKLVTIAQHEADTEADAAARAERQRLAAIQARRQQRISTRPSAQPPLPIREQWQGPPHSVCSALPMVKFPRARGASLKVHFLARYFPKWHPSYFSDRATRMILNLKDGGAPGVRFFHERLEAAMNQCPDERVLIAAVPGHLVGPATSGLRALIAGLPNAVDVSRCLVRASPVRQSHMSGPSGRVREGEHRASLRVQDSADLRGKHVLLIDDVVTTGSTLSAARAALDEAGVRTVTCLALGRTVSRFGENT